MKTILSLSLQAAVEELGGIIMVSSSCVVWLCCYVVDLCTDQSFPVLLDCQLDKVEMVRQTIVEEALPSMTILAIILDVMGRVGQ